MDQYSGIFYWTLIGIGMILAVWAYRRSRSLEKKSEATRKGISRVLRSMAPLREWKVLDGVTLADKKGEVTADHLVIGPFGALVLTDIHRPGGH